MPVKHARTTAENFTETADPDSPVFRDELHNHHVRLQLLLRAIDEVLSTRSGGSESQLLCSALVVLLTDLQTELPVHFEFEERGGYFSDVMRLAPRMSRELDRLKGDHLDFVERSRALLDLAYDVLRQSGRWGEVQIAFGALSTRLRIHERKENAIMQEVFSLDIGQPG